MQLLAEFLDLAPLIVANVRRHVLDLQLLAVLLLADLDMLVSTQLGGRIGSACRLLLRIMLASWLRIKSSLMTCSHYLIQVLNQRCASTWPAVVLGRAWVGTWRLQTTLLGTGEAKVADGA